MSELKSIDFSSFPHDDNYAQIEDKLYLVDNLHRTYHKAMSMTAPVRLKMTMVFVCAKGYMKIKINLQEYVIQPKMVATLSAGSFMQVLEISSDFKGYLIAIAKDLFDYSHEIQVGLALLHHNYDSPVASMRDEDYQDAIELYNIMKRKLMNQHFRYKEQVARLFLGILHYNGLQAMEDYADSTKPLIASRKDDLTAQFLLLVKENYRVERQIAFYSTRLGVTPKYLSSVVKEVSGKFASDWINEYVILESKALLKNSSLSIKELCTGLNFTSTAVFTKYFKQHTGFTPIEYRRM